MQDASLDLSALYKLRLKIPSFVKKKEWKECIKGKVDKNM